MTNNDYEAASVTAAQVFDRFEGQHKLAQYDAAIRSTEETLRRLQEERREIINRYDLNKPELDAACSHHHFVTGPDGDIHCAECGALPDSELKPCLIVRVISANVEMGDD